MCSSAQPTTAHDTAVASQRARTGEDVRELDLVPWRALEQGHARQLITDLQHVTISTLSEALHCENVVWQSVLRL